MVYFTILLVAFMTSPLVMSQSLPKVLPLAVKSPYLNYWSHDPLVRADWPMFWTKKVCNPFCNKYFIPHEGSLQLVGWSGMIRIDNVTHQWHGQWISENISVTNRQITPTRTILTLNLGPAELIVTFLSPIEVSTLTSPFCCLHSNHYPDL